MPRDNAITETDPKACVVRLVLELGVLGSARKGGVQTRPLHPAHRSPLIVAYSPWP